MNPSDAALSRELQMQLPPHRSHERGPGSCVDARGFPCIEQGMTQGIPFPEPQAWLLGRAGFAVAMGASFSRGLALGFWKRRV